MPRKHDLLTWALEPRLKSCLAGSGKVCVSFVPFDRDVARQPFLAAAPRPTSKDLSSSWPWVTWIFPLAGRGSLTVRLVCPRGTNSVAAHEDRTTWGVPLINTLRLMSARAFTSRLITQCASTHAQRSPPGSSPNRVDCSKARPDSAQRSAASQAGVAYRRSQGGCGMQALACRRWQGGRGMQALAGRAWHEDSCGTMTLVLPCAGHEGHRGRASRVSHLLLHQP